MDVAGRSGQALLAGAGRRLRPDRGGAGAGRDRRRGDRQGQGPAGGRPGGDLGGALDARRPAAPALAADACPTARRTRPTSTRPPTWRGRGRRRSTPARANGVGAGRLRVAFPGRGLVRAGAGQGGRGRRLESESARHTGRGVGGRRSGGAARGPPASMPAIASGGGYSGPLVYRTGRGDAARRRRRLRPDGRGRRAAPASPWSSSPASAPTPNRRRSSPPIPTRSGSRRRATRCTAAPPSSTSAPNRAYGWLAANAGRFGFVQRYSLGGLALRLRRRPRALLGRPATPRSGRSGGGGDGAFAGAGGLPAFVPARFRAPLLRAAAHWNVSAALLAAQLMAESNFNPFAVSPAGARASPSSCLAPPPPTASPTPSTRSRRSTPRPT